MSLWIRLCNHTYIHTYMGFTVGLEQRQRQRWVAGLRSPSAREHLWHPAVRSVYTNAPSALCTWLCHYGRHILSEIIFLTLGPPPLPPRAVSARTAFSPHAQDLGLLLGLTQTGKKGGDTLNACCLSARVSWAREANWRLSFSGMTT